MKRIIRQAEQPWGKPHYRNGVELTPRQEELVQLLTERLGDAELTADSVTEALQELIKMREEALAAGEDWQTH